MPYNPVAVAESYERNAEIENESEKGPSLRVGIPREFIKRYLQSSDIVLDAGGGTGINAIMMAGRCKKVTLLDITPGILQLAEQNIKGTEVAEKIELVHGDITDLSPFRDGHSLSWCAWAMRSRMFLKRDSKLSRNWLGLPREVRF